MHFRTLSFFVYVTPFFFQFGFHCIVPICKTQSIPQQILRLWFFFYPFSLNFISIVFCRHPRCNRECVQAIELCLILQFRKLNGKIGLKTKSERNAIVKKREEEEGETDKNANAIVSLILQSVYLWGVFVFEFLNYCHFVWVCMVSVFFAPGLLPTRDSHPTFPVSFSLLQHLTISALCFL